MQLRSLLLGKEQRVLDVLGNRGVPQNVTIFGIQLEDLHIVDGQDSVQNRLDVSHSLMSYLVLLDNVELRMRLESAEIHFPTLDTLLYGYCPMLMWLLFKTATSSLVSRSFTTRLGGCTTTHALS